MVREEKGDTFDDLVIEGINDNAATEGVYNGFRSTTEWLEDSLLTRAEKEEEEETEEEETCAVRASSHSSASILPRWSVSWRGATGLQGRVSRGTT